MTVGELLDRIELAIRELRFCAKLAESIKSKMPEKEEAEFHRRFASLFRILNETKDKILDVCEPDEVDQ